MDVSVDVGAHVDEWIRIIFSHIHIHTHTTGHHKIAQRTRESIV